MLGGAYRVARAEIGATLRELLRARHLSFAAPDQVSRALDAFARGRGDFADYVIREHAKAADCDRVATFDRTLQRETGFVGMKRRTD